ncbi:MAG: hypothetical protein P9L94_08675 [Candidatus Hinthialibacter antarcticus]|nr:hypothetical protein [Candidatus Hinthialibacter antarcticus]
MEFLKQLHSDYERLHGQKKWQNDDAVQATLVQCFNLIIERLAQDAFNELTFVAVRKCFASLAVEIESLQNDPALNVLKTCIDLDAGELLVLQAYHDAENAPAASNAVDNWIATLSQHTGIASQDRLKSYNNSLVTKNILEKKNTKKITPGPTYRLTEIGTAAALSIAVGSRILHSM